MKQNEYLIYHVFYSFYGIRRGRKRGRSLVMIVWSSYSTACSSASGLDSAPPSSPPNQACFLVVFNFTFIQSGLSSSEAARCAKLAVFNSAGSLPTTAAKLLGS
mmetsp:Transcript_31251/g.52096  ORF Transcript_31251/g.52096 Transcript_31251/m.52096 type:complete len:104 (+) Transcript_31251:3815-4126(+)